MAESFYIEMITDKSNIKLTLQKCAATYCKTLAGMGS